MIIDTQEPDKIHRFFQDEKDYKKEKLPVGDIYFPDKDIIIERKEISDYVLSVINKHIQKQLLQMQQFKHKFLIISGTFADYQLAMRIKRKTPSFFTVNHYIGSLASCAVRYGITILMVDNDIQLCKLAMKLYEKIGDGKVITYRDTELLSNQISTKDYRVKVLTGFKGIGLKKAEKLLDKPEILDLLIQLENHIL